MNCRFCGAELPEEQTLCPACGGENAEKLEQPVEKTEQPAKKKTPTRLIITVTAVVLAAALVIGLILYGLAGGFTPKDNDIFYKDNYSANSFWAGAKADDVVATVGERTLTNAELQIYYWIQVYDFLSVYGGYASYLGLDYTAPLSDQVMDEESGMTWEQYFMEEALYAWQRYTLLEEMAAKEGFTLPEDYQKNLQELRTNMEKTAKDSGLASVEELLQQEMGPGASFAMYEKYLKAYYTGNLYFSSLYEKMDATQEELEAYYTKNASSLVVNNGAFKVTKESGYLVDVRHILIMPTGGTKSEDGKTTVYSDEEWEAARVKAQKIYDEWLAGDKTEDSFAESAFKNSVDGSKSRGGLYEYVYKGQMVKEFEDWCFDETRKTGDHGLVKTQYGYHVMYYVTGEEGWVRLCTEGVRQEKATKMLAQAMSDTPITVTYSAITLPAHTVPTAS